MPLCYQINLQTSPGGGEIFTRFLTEALSQLGWESRLIVTAGAGFWAKLKPGAELVPIPDGNHLQAALPDRGGMLISHNVMGEALASRLAERHRLGGIVHMPYFERAVAGLPRYHRLFPVSHHVASSLEAAGLSNVMHREPLWGVADLSPRDGSPSQPTVKQGPVYEWDRRKFRDVLLGTCEAWSGGLRRKPVLQRRKGLTLGIVSRITPIKQFPALFSILSPIIARMSDVHLEVFGSGGYASVRDLRQALRPLHDRVRFWGEQPDVSTVYPMLDYVLSGLPEKEALGLNLIEAQVAGTPVLAVKAPPFTETVLDGVTGYLYRDPREDGGTAFGTLLARILRGEAELSVEGREAHLRKFSRAAFRERVARAMSSLAAPGMA